MVDDEIIAEFNNCGYSALCFQDCDGIQTTTVVDHGDQEQEHIIADRNQTAVSFVPNMPQAPIHDEILGTEFLLDYAEADKLPPYHGEEQVNASLYQNNTTSLFLSSALFLSSEGGPVTSQQPKVRRRNLLPLETGLLLKERKITNRKI